MVITVKAGAGEAVTLKATGSAKFKKTKGKLSLKPVSGKASAGTLKVLKLGAKNKKKARKAIGRKGKATITVKLTDAVGNTATKKITVQLK